MVPPHLSARTLLLGRDRFQRRLDVLLAVALGVLTAVAYAADVFELGGGVVLVPFHAAVVGLVAAAGVGYRRGGLVPAWLVAFTPHVGLNVIWAFLWLSPGRPLGDRLAFVFDPAGLTVAAVTAVVVAAFGYAWGRLFALGAERLRSASWGV